MVKAVVLDVANTLLHKENFFTIIEQTLKEEKLSISISELKLRHKLLSEIIEFPDRTSEEFYLEFNREFLRICGVSDKEYHLSKRIFKNCSYLKWTSYPDVDYLSQLEQELYVISNFKTGLRELLFNKIPSIKLNGVVVSEEIGIKKPDIKIFEYFLSKYNLSANEIVYVGDSIKLDCEPSNLLGIKSYLIDRDVFFPKYKNRLDSLKQLQSHL